MEKRRVVLLSTQRLLGESLEHVLGKIEDVELAASLTLDVQAIETLSANPPAIVLIADDEQQSDRVASLTAQILEKCPDLPVVRVTLANNVARIYSSHTLPARSVDLLELIRSLPLSGISRQ